MTALSEFSEKNIYAYYYDLPFEETLLRHSTKTVSFGEQDLRRWWKPKDYLDCIRETPITPSVTLEEAVRIVREAVRA